MGQWLRAGMVMHFFVPDEREAACRTGVTRFMAEKGSAPNKCRKCRVIQHNSMNGPTILKIIRDKVIEIPRTATEA